MSSFEERVWQHVNKGPGCWEWQGTTTHGYGRFYPRGGGYLYAHRVVYELAKEPIPDGMTIDHLCRNTKCVNPDHLDPVPCKVNTLRGKGPTAQNALKLVCPKGHVYTPDNIYTPPNGGRACRACMRRKWRQQRAKRRVMAEALEARE